MALFQHFDARTGAQLIPLIAADPDRTYCVQGVMDGDGCPYLVTAIGHTLLGVMQPSDTIVDSFLVG